MSEAVISSILAAAEEQIEHLTGRKVTLVCNEVVTTRPVSHAGFFLSQCVGSLGITMQAVTKRDRSEDIVACRQAIILAIKTVIPKISWVAMGRSLKVHHSTIMYHYEEAKQHLAVNDALFMHYWNQLKPLLQ